MSLFDNMNNMAVNQTHGQQSANFQQDEVFKQPITSSEEVSSLIRNTYILLSMTLFFSAITAGIAMISNIPPLHPLLTLVGFFGLFFLTSSLQNSIWGLAAVFALTGFMGFTLGPIISLYLTIFSNGSQLVMMAFGSTATIFLGLSGYALVSRKDFSFLGSFIFAGMIVVLLALIGAWLFSLPGLSLAASAMVVLLMVGYILYQTSDLVHGRETNYIMATVGLYVSIYNLFLSLLQLFGAFMGEE